MLHDLSRSSEWDQEVDGMWVEACQRPDYLSVVYWAESGQVCAAYVTAPCKNLNAAASAFIVVSHGWLTLYLCCTCVRPKLHVIHVLSFCLL